MHDIVIPIYGPNAKHQASNLIEEALDEDGGSEGFEGLCTLFRGRFVIVGDACLDEDIEAIGSELNRVGIDYVLLNNREAVGLNKSIKEALDHVRTHTVSIMRPDISLKDEMWFAKMQKVFNFDGTAGVITTEPGSISSTLPPVKTQTPYAPEACGLMMAKTSYLKSINFGSDDPFVVAAKSAKNFGLSCWAHNGIVYERDNSYRPHTPWRAPSTQETTPSGSRSRTTRSSSSRTTTGMVGSKGSKMQGAKSSSSTSQSSDTV